MDDKPQIGILPDILFFIMFALFVAALIGVAIYLKLM